MSYILEFPPRGPLPHSARKPPYVLFGINGEDVSSSLSPHIPLRIVLYFAPKLKEWLLPLPNQLPRHAERLALRTPFVAVDIRADIDFQGLEWIIAKMLAVSGTTQPREIFLSNPSLVVSVSIHRAWLAFELPITGLNNLHLHMQVKLAMVPAITLEALQVIWQNFPSDSMFVRLAAANFIKSDVDDLYDAKDVASVRYWVSASMDRYRLFKNIEDQLPEPKLKVLSIVNKETAAISEKDVEGSVSKKKRRRRAKPDANFTSAETLKSSLPAHEGLDEQNPMSALLTSALLKLKIEREVEQKGEEQEAGNP